MIQHRGHTKLFGFSKSKLQKTVLPHAHKDLNSLAKLTVVQVSVTNYTVADLYLVKTGSTHLYDPIKRVTYRLSKGKESYLYPQVSKDSMTASRLQVSGLLAVPATLKIDRIGV